MTVYFGDASYFIARLNRRDQAHEAAVGLKLPSDARLVTTAWVVVEVANHMTPIVNRRIFVQWYRGLRSDPLAEIVPADSNLFERGVRLYESRTDKTWSLTDCISFVVMQDRHITEALATDVHFEQAGFERLLK